MKIAYYSLSGNIRRMLRESGIDLANCIDVKKREAADRIESDFILITSTYTDRIPSPVIRFLDKLSAAEKLKLMHGVIGSGNRNFGLDFCAAAHHIAADYNVPMLMQVEVWGTQEDHERLRALTNKSIAISGLACK